MGLINEAFWGLTPWQYVALMEHKRREQREAAQWVIWSSCRNAAIWGAKENNDPQAILDRAYPLDGVEQKEKKALPEKIPATHNDVKRLSALLELAKSKGIEKPRYQYTENGIQYDVLIEDRIKELENADTR